MSIMNVAYRRRDRSDTISKFIGKRMLFLSSWPCGELRNVVILGKKTGKKDSYFFGKREGGSDSTTRDFLFEIPSDMTIDDSKAILSNFGIEDKYGKDI